MAITDEGEYSGVMFAVDEPFREEAFVQRLPEALNNKVIFKADGGTKYSIHQVWTGTLFLERGNAGATISPPLPKEHKQVAEDNLRMLLALVDEMTTGEVRFI